MLRLAGGRPVQEQRSRKGQINRLQQARRVSVLYCFANDANQGLFLQYTGVDYYCIPVLYELYENIQIQTLFALSATAFTTFSDHCLMVYKILDMRFTTFSDRCLVMYKIQDTPFTLFQTIASWCTKLRTRALHFFRPLPYGVQNSGHALKTQQTHTARSKASIVECVFCRDVWHMAGGYAIGCVERLSFCDCELAGSSLMEAVQVLSCLYKAKKKTG